MDENETPGPADSSIDHKHSIEYWDSLAADVHDVLIPGYPQLSRIDLISSTNFLTKLRRGKQKSVKRPLTPLNRIADCGAGNGRISRALLLGAANKVDVVEPVKKFTDNFLERVDESQKDKVGEIFQVGLQDWTPESGVYDLIWNQWCLGHLTDKQLTEYFKRCKDGLVRPSTEDGTEAKREGYIVVKENISTDPKNKDIYDELDSSVTRTDSKWKQLFKEAGLKIVAEEPLKGFPEELFPVRTYALKPE